MTLWGLITLIAWLLEKQSDQFHTTYMVYDIIIFRR